MNKTDLSKYDNSWYNTGGGKIKRLFWYFVNEWFINCGWLFVPSIKVMLLRAFGAKIGKGVMVKPHVNVKYPWNLTIGDYAWIGEGVWIDSLVPIHIGANAVVSQGAMLLTGNHNYKSPTFDLIVKEIHIEDGAWVGAHNQLRITRAAAQLECAVETSDVAEDLGLSEFYFSRWFRQMTGISPTEYRDTLRAGYHRG